MKKVIVILISCLIISTINGQDLKEFSKTEICFCVGFYRDSLVLLVNDSIVYSGYIDTLNDTYQFEHSIFYDDISFNSLRIIVYMHDDIEDLKQGRILPNNYSEKPTLDLSLNIFNNTIPNFIYFEGGLGRVYFYTSEEEIFFR